MDEDTYSSLEDAEFKEAFDEFDKVGYRVQYNAAQQEACAYILIQYKLFNKKIGHVNYNEV